MFYWWERTWEETDIRIFLGMFVFLGWVYSFFAFIHRGSDIHNDFYGLVLVFGFALFWGLLSFSASWSVYPRKMAPFLLAAPFVGLIMGLVPYLLTYIIIQIAGT